MTVKEYIELGKASFGLEMGSTRIKAVLIGEDFAPIASGSHEWENRLENGIWTYRLEDVWQGLQVAYADLKKDVAEKYGVKLTKLASMGFSAMMHGYLAFDKNENQLAQFRTWRNTMTEASAAELTALLDFNIPQRWSIAHLYQAILNKEEHVSEIASINTLAGYVHYKLTGRRVLGIGDASGMFPIDSESGDYNKAMLRKFREKITPLGYSWEISDILPQVLVAGENAGYLTEEGAKLLDPTGDLLPGVPLCPPEGDAGTGMTATNSVAARTGNVSAGTSIFSMVVLEKPLSRVYPEIDMVTTPTGKAVAMVHCNNCTSDINAWAEMFCGLTAAVGNKISYYQALDAIFYSALKGDRDCGGVMTVNYFSGEPVTYVEEGRPLLVRRPDSKFSFENLSRSLVCSAMAALKLGMDILTDKENVPVDTLYGHGGFFKAKGVGQSLMAGALKVPVSVMETAGEGGPWGMAVLAAYLVNNRGETLEDYLTEKVFAGSRGDTLEPTSEDMKGFEGFIADYVKALEVEKTAVKLY